MCFRCGLEDHFIGKFPKLDTSDKKVHWNTEKNKTCAYRSKQVIEDICIYGTYT